jgi:hypothetical protein
MSEYNDNVQPDECCDESMNGDEHDDIFDDLHNIDDSEV